mgnify:CR=1 FL=1|jgi:hypothetical protein
MKNYIKYNFHKETFIKNLILVTGTHTSGKSMISPIIASFKKVEILRKIFTLDQIAVLTNFGKIKKDTSTYLARNILDYSYYEQLIGRNLNFRYEDETGIYQSKNPDYFKKRIYRSRGPKVLKEHNKINTHMLLDTHDGLWFHDFWSSLGIKNLKIISIFRNPIDMVNSWINLDLAVTEKEILNQIPLLKNKKNLKAWYYYKSLNKLSNNKNDIVVDMVGECFLKDLSSYEKIRNKKNIYRIEFNNFAENTSKVIKNINSFLKLDRSQFTKKIMNKERLPRKINDQDLNEKLNKIKNLVTKKKYLKLLELEKNFHKHKKKFKL